MSDFSIQKIKFNKNVKATKIKKHCKQLLGQKSVVIKSLAKSNDVVNLPMKYFIAKSLKKEVHHEFTIFIGRLKPSHAKLHGAGLGDIFNKLKNTVSSIFSLRDGFNNKAQAMIKKYGDQQISSISVFRAPVAGSSLLVKVINGLSSKEIPYEKLFHLGLLITINGTRIRLEKNEVIGIDDNYTLKSETETIDVPYNKQLTFNELLNNTVNKVGKERMFKYSAFNYNCQCFTKDILESNGLYSNDIHSFVYQPMEDVVKNLKGFVPTIANAVTNTSAYINKLIGGNKLSKNEHMMLQQVLRLLHES